MSRNNQTYSRNGNPEKVLDDQYVQNDGNYPIHLAVLNNNISALSLFSLNDFMQKNKDELTPIELAAKDTNWEMVIAIANKIDSLGYWNNYLFTNTPVKVSSNSLGLTSAFAHATSANERNAMKALKEAGAE